MGIVLDNNILFSLMNPVSSNSLIFSYLNHEFFAPDFIFDEFQKYHTDCLKKSKLSEKDFLMRKKEIFNSIKFVPFEDYKKFLKESISNLPDPSDSPYLALALSINGIIWSNDKHLKQQSLIKTFNTSEMIEIFFD